MGRTSTTKSPAKTTKVTTITETESRVLRNTLRSTSKDKKDEQIQIITKTKTVSVKEDRKKFRKSKKVEVLITTKALRPRKESNFVWRTGKGIDDDYDYEDDSYLTESSKPRKRANGGPVGQKLKKDWLKEEFDDIFEEETATKKDILEEALDKIPKNKKQLQKLKETVDDKLKLYKEKFIKEQKELADKKSKVPEDAIPICSDVRTFDFLKLAESQKKFGGKLFDVIMMDPPWQLSTSMPSRGVAIAFESLSDETIMRMPVGKLQDSGFLFIWTINAKYAVAARLLEHWGYTLVDEVTWIKKTVHGKIAKGHGYYLQHAKESCLVGVKGKLASNVKKGVGSDVIFSERRGQSQKPEEIYTLIEKLVPNGFYLEIFGRRNNLRSRWVTVGNEL